MDTNDPRSVRKQAAQSTLPQFTVEGSNGYQRQPQVPSGTSMLMEGQPSLARLTISTSLPPLSISTSMGAEALNNALVLEPDGIGNLVVPLAQGLVNFQCPFRFLDCPLSFGTFSEWFTHSLKHFRMAGPPKSNKCCFCKERFDCSSGQESWRQRMEHIEFHHRLGHHRDYACPDFELYEYLWQKKLIPNHQYKELKAQQGRCPPTRPLSSSGSPPAASPFTVTAGRRERDR